jgi:hypothetical protein
MLNGKYRGKDIGSGTDVWRFSEAVRAGTMSPKDFYDAEACSAWGCPSLVGRPSLCPRPPLHHI